MEKIVFLGYVVTVQGIEKDEKKVMCIMGIIIHLVKLYLICKRI
jgi:hypothetical protein